MNTKHENSVLYYEPYVEGLYGNQQYSLLLFKHLKANNWQPSLLTPTNGDFTEAAASMNVPTYTVRYPSILHNQRGLGESSKFMQLLLLLGFLGNNLKVLTILLKLRPSVIHCNNLRAVLSIGIAARILNIPLVWYVKAMGNPSQERLGFFLANHVAYLANALRVQMIGTPGEQAISKTSVLPLGTPPLKQNIQPASLRQQLKLAETDIVLFTAASLNPNKGLHYMIEAMQEISTNNPNVYLVIAGEANSDAGRAYKKQLLHMVEKFNLKPRVRFLGWRSDVIALLQESNILIMASHKEGVPHSIVEAMQVGIPIIAPRTGGIPETVLEGKTGLLFDVADVDGLQRCIYMLLNDHQLMKEMGDRGKEYSKKYSIEQTIQQLIGIYRGLIPS